MMHLQTTRACVQEGCSMWCPSMLHTGIQCSPAPCHYNCTIELNHTEHHSHFKSVIPDPLGFGRLYIFLISCDNLNLYYKEIKLSSFLKPPIHEATLWKHHCWQYCLMYDTNVVYLYAASNCCFITIHQLATLNDYLIGNIVAHNNFQQQCCLDVASMLPCVQGFQVGLGNTSTKKTAGRSYGLVNTRHSESFS